MAVVISGTTGIDAGSLPVSNCGNTEVEGNLNLSGTGASVDFVVNNTAFGAYDTVKLSGKSWSAR